jgi:flavorubredoxin
MDIDMIVPQHGTAFVGKEMINQFLDWIEGLECGVDLMNEYVFSIPAEIS